MRLPYKWGAYDQIAGTGDVDRDGRPDLVTANVNTNGDNGNTVLLKHAGICAASNALMEEILLRAGLPEGGFVNLLAHSSIIPDVIGDPRVQGVSLTGSERAGTAVAKTAAENLKKAVLELGGSDALIVLDDADGKKTGEWAASARAVERRVPRGPPLDRRQARRPRAGWRRSCAG